MPFFSLYFTLRRFIRIGISLKSITLLSLILCMFYCSSQKEIQLSEDDLVSEMHCIGKPINPIWENLNTDKAATKMMIVSFLAAKLDCEEERAEFMGLQLEKKRNEDLASAGILSTLFGAIGDSITNLMFLANPSGLDARLIDLIGTSSGATYGIYKKRQLYLLNYEHSLNPLRELCIENQSRFFPNFVWQLLINPSSIEKSPRPQSIRNKLLTRWASILNQDDLLERCNKLRDSNKTEWNKASSIVRLLFGNGGMYTAEELELRATFFDEFESEINLLREDLFIEYISERKIQEDLHITNKLN